MHQTHFFEFEKSKIHYSKIGSGAKSLLAFHGFGQDHSAFDEVAKQLTERYTIYSFDLFYHGKSHWKEGHPEMSKSIWGDILKAFIKHHDIDTFSVICFSMGGKFALTSMQTIPEKIDKVIMIAPDGIQTSMWYNLATYPIIFQDYFRSMIVRPARFYFILKMMRKLKLVDKGILRFAQSQMNSTKKRRRVYYSWVVFKSLTFDMNKIALITNANQIGLTMILGTYDKIITRKGMQKLLNKLDHHQLEMVESGHNDLIRNLAKETDLVAEF